MISYHDLFCDDTRNSFSFLILFWLDLVELNPFLMLVGPCALLLCYFLLPWRICWNEVSVFNSDLFDIEMFWKVTVYQFFFIFFFHFTNYSHIFLLEMSPKTLFSIIQNYAKLYRNITFVHSPYLERTMSIHLWSCNVHIENDLYVVPMILPLLYFSAKVTLGKIRQQTIWN